MAQEPNDVDSVEPYLGVDCCSNPEVSEAPILDEEPTAEVQFICENCGEDFAEVYWAQGTTREEDGALFDESRDTVPECTCDGFDSDNNSLMYENFNKLRHESVSSGVIQFIFECEHCRAEFTRKFEFQYQESV